MNELYLYGFGSGGGAGLNFKVFGGTAAPEDPGENAIWVNTQTEIPGWVFSPGMPEEPARGMVWFKTDNTSPVGFNALENNRIQVNPVSAKQYVDGAWAGVPAFSFQNGAWTEWRVCFPCDYQEVEYLQSSGKQYIDTGIVPSNDSYQTNLKIANTGEAVGGVVFGTEDGFHYHLTSHGGKNWYYGTNGEQRSGGVCSSAAGLVYEIEFNNGAKGITINGETIATGETFLCADSAIWIGSRRSLDNAPRGSYKYYYFRVSDHTTGEVLMDLVPCYRKADSVAGMYDLVSKMFLPNSGTGAFIVGEDVL